MSEKVLTRDGNDAAKHNTNGGKISSNNNNCAGSLAKKLVE